METCSCEYGFILKWINRSYYTSKEAIGLKIVCVGVERTVDNHLEWFCACSYMKMKRERREQGEEKVSNVLC